MGKWTCLTSPTYSNLKYSYSFISINITSSTIYPSTMQDTRNSMGVTRNSQAQHMQKTGIASIDSFFNYGESNDKFETYPFQPLIHTVIQMFESEYTENLHDRKAKAIQKFCKEREFGFFYEEIQGLTKLFHLAQTDLFNGVEEMAAALTTILQVDSPDKNSMFNKNSGSDQLRYSKYLPEFLDSLEPLLNYKAYYSGQQCRHLQLVKKATVEYLSRFIQRQIPEIISKEQTFENQKNDVQQFSPIKILLVQGTKHLRAVCASEKLIPALVNLLNNYQNQQETVFTLVRLYSHMMMYSRLAYELSQQGVIRLVFEIMLRCEDFRSQLLKTAFQIFWSAIEAVGVQCLSLILRQDYIDSLKDLFVRIIRQGYKLEDKCQRNQIMILINYLLSLPQAIELFLKRRELGFNKYEESFLELLFNYATSDELKFGDSKSRAADQKVLFGTNAEDLELKKLLWSGLLTSVESNNQKVVFVAQQSNFIKNLLIYIDTANNSYAVTRWSPPQLRELQQHALSILSNLVLYMKDDFEEKKGIFCLTKFLSNVTDIERRERCLRAFSNASLFGEEYKIKISEQGVIDYLLDFLQSQERENPVQIKELCLTILANLCQDCKKNKKMFRQKHGIDILITYLKDKNIATSNRYILLGLSLLNCLWNAVLGSRRSEQRFLNAQGLFDLLQFIEVCEYSHRKMALSCLCYLTENSKTSEQFLEWNSETTMINGTQLLLKIYSEQDQRFGVRYEQGVIANKRKPLVPQDMKKTLMHRQEETYLKDFTEAGMQTYLVNRIKEQVEEYDLRLIIFSILYRIGFNKNDLNAQEQQKMEVVQMYPHFKLGQVWHKIRAQLAEQGTEPTFDDRHWMETCIEEFAEQMNNCVNTQGLIIKEFHKTQEFQLSRFYQIVKYNKQLK